MRDEFALRLELAEKVMGFMVSQAIGATTKLGVPDALADGPCGLEELAAAVDAHTEPLGRFLRLLTEYGIFREEEGRFANTELSDLLRDVPGSSRDFAIFFTEAMYPAWGEALRTLQTGEPAFEHALGRPFWEHLEANPELNDRFNRFMGSRKGGLGEALAAQTWRGDETIVDVGGGNGTTLISLLEQQTELRGIVFDLPHVAEQAGEQIRTAGLADRCRAEGGSFFDGVPADGDAYLLSTILHDWSDEHARTILGHIRQAIRDDGRLLVVDLVVRDEGQGTMPRLMDTLMLVAVGGRERSEEEWRALLASGGFALADIRLIATEQTLLEATPS